MYRAIALTRVAAHLRPRHVPTSTPITHLSTRAITTHTPPQNKPPSDASPSTAAPTDTEAAFEEEQVENLLLNTKSRENIHKAFAERAKAAMRYEYYAQRAELECETEAASLFRSFVEASKQQSLGYLELMEEYADADFGATMHNLDVAADEERANAQGHYVKMASVAADEQLEEVQEWFEDMAEASHKASARLDMLSSVMDADLMPEDHDDDEEHDEESVEHDAKQSRK